MNIKNILFSLLVMANLLLFTSCATILGGSKNTVELTSTPPGADVYLNGKVIGKTPLEYNFEKALKENKRLIVQIQHQDLPPQRVLIEKEFNYLATLNLANVFFWGADALMDNLKKVSKDKIHVNFEEKGLLGKAIKKSEDPV